MIAEQLRERAYHLRADAEAYLSVLEAAQDNEQ